jgi:prolyl-tRNA synthetase
VVGKALEQGKVEIRIRKSGEKNEVAVEAALEAITSTLKPI